MASQFQDKTCLITGANKGIGYEIAKQLGERGAKVIITARSSTRGMAALEKLRKLNLDVHFIQLDVANEESIVTAAYEFGTRFKTLDVLVNNAAILPDESSDILLTETGTIWETLRTNAVGALAVTQAFTKFIPIAGRIINISSGAGSLKDMGSYSPAYSISKTALNAITRQLASSLQKNKIAVNSVCPGWVKTDMGGRSATRTVEKGAETAVWLATEASQSLTGKFLRDKKEIEW